MGSKIEVKLIEKDVCEVRKEMADMTDRIGGLERNMTAARGLMMEIKESLGSGGGAEKTVRDSLTAYCQQRRLEVPAFSGEDPCGWILKAEKYFMLYGIEEGQKVAYATLCMEGKALNWLLWMEARNPIQGWQMFKDELMKRFQSTKGRSALEQLLSLRQSTTVAHYRGQFELFSAPLRDLSDEMLKWAFIKGLSDDVKAEVKLAGPRDLARVMSLAQEIENGNKISEKMEDNELVRSSGDYSKPNSFDEKPSRAVDPRSQALKAHSNLPVVKTDSPKTFKLLGKIGSREVIVLIGTAATHNFISYELVAGLKIPVKRTRRFHVTFVDGSKVEGAEVCKNVILKMQGVEIVQRFFPLDLASADVFGGKKNANADIVLGGEWLRTLGGFSLSMDDGAFTMTFKWQGRKTTLQADPYVANVLRVDEGGQIIHEAGLMILQWDNED